jgi:hypothetical protein
LFLRPFDQISELFWQYRHNKNPWLITLRRWRSPFYRKRKADAWYFLLMKVILNTIWHFKFSILVNNRKTDGMSCLCFLLICVLGCLSVYCKSRKKNIWWKSVSVIDKLITFEPMMKDTFNDDIIYLLDSWFITTGRKNIIKPWVNFYRTNIMHMPTWVTWSYMWGLAFYSQVKENMCMTESFHYSTYFSSIISIYFHYSTYFSSVFSIHILKCGFGCADILLIDTCSADFPSSFTKWRCLCNVFNIWCCIAKTKGYNKRRMLIILIFM